MAKNTYGNALITVLLISSLMGLLALVSLKSSSWASSLHSAVYAQEKQFRFAQGVLDCGISKARRDFDRICKGKKTVVGSILHEDLNGQLVIKPNGSTIAVICNILSGQEPIYTLKAELIKDSQSNVRIQCFQR